MAAFRGNISQRDVIQQVRQRLRKFRDIRVTVRNIPGFNIGGGSFDIDFVIRGSDLVALADYGERLRRSTPGLRGIVGADKAPRPLPPAGGGGSRSPRPAPLRRGKERRRRGA